MVFLVVSSRYILRNKFNNNNNNIYQLTLKLITKDRYKSTLSLKGSTGILEKSIEWSGNCKKNVKG